MELKKILSVVGIIILIGTGCYIFNYSKWVCAYKYTLAYNTKNFNRAYSYYNPNDIIRKFDKEEIISFLERQSKAKEKVKARELSVIRDKKTKKYFVKFPYKLENLNILAPVGSDIYINNKRIVKGVLGEGIEVKDLLPGEHIVTIEYYNDMYLPFTRRINIPQETRVESPYITCDISVFAPLGSWIKIGDIKKLSGNKQTEFKNMLPGQYDITLLMEDQSLPVFSQKIQIDSENTSLELSQVKGDIRIKNDLQTFFDNFNKEYKKGILERDTSFLHKFSTDKINDNIISDFKMWYIDNKDIESANSHMEVREVYPQSGNSIKVAVLETVYLTNREKDGQDKDIKEEYRVVIEWDYKMLRSNSNWKIINREILQSIVAYKDEEGNWVIY